MICEAGQAAMEWGFEDGIEIIIKGKGVLEVREF